MMLQQLWAGSMCYRAVEIGTGLDLVEVKRTKPWQRYALYCQRSSAILVGE